MYKLEKIAPCTYKLPQDQEMRVPGLIIGSEKLLESEEIQKSLEQVRNVACLPGIVGYSIAMPDMHWGYGFPIGGVAAMDPDTGVISPGGVGYDINCGVRLAIIKHPFQSLSEAVKEKLIDHLFKLIPSGVGHGHRGESLTDEDYKKIFHLGAKWSVEQGYGFSEDLDFTENHGVLKGADFASVSEVAKNRGKNQLGSIGSGNHFIEIGEVETLYMSDIGEMWNIEKGEIYILIHSGSRGLGHQVCQDTLETFVKKGYAKNLPDVQLACAPIHSELGKEYFAAMASAANYAFNNRQQILHRVREAFFEICHIPPHDVKLLYDVCHNIAKFEEHVVNGKLKTLCVHRKGATRAFGPGHKELSTRFQKSGQPVLVPGDMQRASFLLVGSGNALTYCSCCHGAGRLKSRIKSMKAWDGKDLALHMKQKGVLVRASSFKTVAEEMPDAYKKAEDVVDAVSEAGLAEKVARLIPHLVIKG